MSDNFADFQNDRGNSLLSARNLQVEFAGYDQTAPATEVLRGVNLELGKGQTLALIGESGCGKSMSALAFCGLLPESANWSGDIVWKGQRLVDPRGQLWRSIRGSGIGLVLQEPTQCLNPVVSVGRQIAESLVWHKGLTKAAAWNEAIVLLGEVQVPDPQIRADFYPHQLSGGMCQRVMLAASLACDPDLLIADEPTTSLDPTVQREILLLLRQIIEDRAMALLFITHDHDLVPVMADHVARMQDGQIVSLEDVSSFSATNNNSEGEMSAPEVIPVGESVLAARNVSVTFGIKNKRPVTALRSVDIDLFHGQILGLAGESGCGKTTLARVLSGHLAPGEGVVKSPGGRDFYALRGSQRRKARRKVQLIFQNAAGSLNPRQRVGETIEEAADGQACNVPQALIEVGLPLDLQFRFPHELSGGQRQRVAIARALACSPEVLVADEPTTALDPKSRIQVLELLSEITRRRQLALLVISHDLTVLHQLCSRVALMFGGYIVEVYRPNGGVGCKHPYGIELWRSQPRFWSDDSDGVLGARKGVKFTLNSSTKGCPYAIDCQLCNSLCRKELPKLKSLKSGDFLRCTEVGF